MQQGGRIKQASFEDSDFKGDGIFVDSLRWWRQLLALLEKNSLIFYRRPFYLLSALLVPSIAVIAFMIGDHEFISSPPPSTPKLQTPTLLQGLGACDAYYQDRCVQVAYSPAIEPYRQVMSSVMAHNKLGNIDVKAFADDLSLQASCYFCFVLVTGYLFLASSSV